MPRFSAEAQLGIERHDGGSAPLISVVIPTCRPGLLADALSMVEAQTYRPLEVIVALHGLRRAGLPPAAHEALAAVGARVMELPASLPLGSCLDLATAEAAGRFIAKVDDDDLYGPGYLSEAADALLAGRGDVVGKSEMYVYLAQDRELLLWRPGSSNMEQDHLLGGTLTFRRELARSPGFTGPGFEMPRFLEGCRRAGRRIYATSRRHFVLRRLAGQHQHTWHPDHALFRDEGVSIRKGIGPAASDLLPLVS